MRILYHHRTRATDAQLVHIREMVAAFRALGHQVEVASLVSTERERRDAQREAGEAWWKRLVRRIPLAYEVVQLLYNAIGLPLLLWKMRGGVDLIYERYSLFNFAGVLAARLCRRPIVLEVNSPLALEEYREKAIRAVGFARWMERRIANAATRVIVVSGPLRRLMIENGVEASRLLVLPNGVNLEHFRRGRNAGQLRTALGLNGKCVIGFAGWFRQWHGLDLLLEAFHRADLERRGAALLLIGDGPAMPALKEYVANHGLEQAVVFTGPVPHEDAPAYIELLDIAVQPGANEYCCPIKILEYMALGKPIVAPRQENIEELLRDGEEALLFRPGEVESLREALTTLAADPQQRVAIEKRALEALRRRGLSWTTNAQAVIDIAASVRPAARTSPATAQVEIRH